MNRRPHLLNKWGTTYYSLFYNEYSIGLNLWLNWPIKGLHYVAQTNHNALNPTKIYGTASRQGTSSKIFKSCKQSRCTLQAESVHFASYHRWYTCCIIWQFRVLNAAAYRAYTAKYSRYVYTQNSSNSMMQPRTVFRLFVLPQPDSISPQRKSALNKVAGSHGFIRSMYTVILELRVSFVYIYNRYVVCLFGFYFATMCEFNQPINVKNAAGMLS